MSLIAFYFCNVNNTICSTACLYTRNYALTPIVNLYKPALHAVVCLRIEWPPVLAMMSIIFWVWYEVARRQTVFGDEALYVRAAELYIISRFSNISSIKPIHFYSWCDVKGFYNLCIWYEALVIGCTTDGCLCALWDCLTSYICDWILGDFSVLWFADPWECSFSIFCNWNLKVRRNCGLYSWCWISSLYVTVQIDWNSPVFALGSFLTLVL